MQEERKIIWWKDIKFLMGCLLIILSFVLGTFGKGLFFVKFYQKNLNSLKQSSLK